MRLAWKVPTNRRRAAIFRAAFLETDETRLARRVERGKNRTCLSTCAEWSICVTSCRPCSVENWSTFMCRSSSMCMRERSSASVIVAINNDTNPATVSFGVQPLALANGVAWVDRLASVGNVRVSDGRLALDLPARTAVVLSTR